MSTEERLAGSDMLAIVERVIGKRFAFETDGISIGGTIQDMTYTDERGFRLYLSTPHLDNGWNALAFDIKLGKAGTMTIWKNGVGMPENQPGKFTIID